LTLTTTNTSTNKLKYLISQNHYSVLVVSEPLLSTNTNTNNENVINLETLSQGSQNSSTHTPRKQISTTNFHNKNVINISEIRKAFSDITGPDFFSYNTNSTHLKLQLDTPENCRKIMYILNNNNAEFHTFQLQSDKAFKVFIIKIHPSAHLFRDRFFNLDVANGAKTILKNRRPNHSNFLTLFDMAIILKMTRNVLITKNINNVTDILPIENILSNNLNTSNLNQCKAVQD